MAETEGQLERGEKLIALHQAKKLLEEAEHLLKVLPQGRESTLDADMVDGLHAAEIVAEAVAQVSEKVLKRLGRGGGGGLAVHGNEHHSPNFFSDSSEVDHGGVGGLGDDDHTQYLLVDGSRAMTGAFDIAGFDFENVGDVLPKTANIGNVGRAGNPFYEVVAKYLTSGATGAVFGDSFREVTSAHGCDVDGVLCKDGGATLAGDIDLGDYILKLGTTGLMNDGASRLKVALVSTGAVRDLIVRYYKGAGFTGTAGNTYFDSASGVTYRLGFRSYDGAAMQLALDVIGGRADIPRAGDIIFLANKTLKVGNISATGTPATQTKYIPIDDGGVTRYIMLYDSVS